MSWLMATIYDRFMRESEAACLRAWRSELLARVSGRVLEVGAGTGAKLEFYGEGVSQLVLCEPDRRMAKQLDAKLAPSLRRRAQVDTAALPLAARDSACVARRGRKMVTSRDERRTRFAPRGS